MVVDRNAQHKLTWQESDAKYKARGRRMAIGHDPQWDGELEEMNKNKVGRPFKFSHGMMAYIAISRALVDVSYRVLEGYLEGSWGEGVAVPEFTTIWKRIGKNMPRFQQTDISGAVEGRVLRLAIDATGMALHNRGEWIREKWNVKRGFLKMHLLINLDTRRIMSFKLTDMNGGDAGQLPELLNKLLKKYTGESLPLTGQLAEIVTDAASTDTAGKHVRTGQRLISEWMYDNTSESKSVDGNQEGPEEPTEGDQEGPEEPTEGNQDECKTGDEDSTDIINEAFVKMRQKLQEMGITMEMRGDGGYDTRNVFSILAKLGISPIIKVRINSNARAGGVDRARSLAVLDQLGGKGGCTNRSLNRMVRDERLANQKDWKERMRYGLRWIVEIVISAFKRVFGESVRAFTPRTTYIEIATRVAAYNHNLDIGDAAVQRMRDGCRAASLPKGQMQLTEVAA